MRLEILLVEDESPKSEAIQSAVSKKFSNANILTARSVRTAIAALRKMTPSVILLDMSLPTFDIEPGEPGGRPQGYGGEEVLRFLKKESISIPTLVITAYEAFARNGKTINHVALSDRLMQEFPDNYKGLVYFDPIHDKWGKDFELALSKIIEGIPT